jgi:hypothetical protein
VEEQRGEWKRRRKTNVDVEDRRGNMRKGERIEYKDNKRRLEKDKKM